MDLTTWIIIGVALVAIIVGGFLFFRDRQKKLNQGFEQISLMLRQIPKQKKQSFILFMFRESAKAGKNVGAVQAKLNDQKYVEIQLLQMNLLLADRTKAKDKKTKQALQMYDAYLKWEKKGTGSVSEKDATKMDQKTREAAKAASNAKAKFLAKTSGGGKR